MDKIMSIAENLDNLRDEVQSLRAQYGHDICTDIVVDEDTASYTFMPNDPTGYTMEVYLPTGERRHCGLGAGCFWVDIV